MALIAETEEKIAELEVSINECGSDYQKLMELNASLDAENEKLFSYMEEWESLSEEE